MSTTLSMPRICGHRGAADVAPENTLAGFRRALADGAEALEFDLHLSADGHDVVIHDATIDRTAQEDSPRRTGAVAEMTRAELDEVLVGDGEHIPTLAQVLEVAVREDGTRVPLLVEIKAPAVAAQVARRLLETIGEADWQAPDAPARIISFHPEALAAAREVAPAIDRGLMLHGGLTEDGIQAALSVGASSLRVRACDHRDGDVDRIREHGLRGGVWGMRTDQELRLALDLGADMIGADDPAGMRERIRRIIGEHSPDGAEPTHPEEAR